MLPDQCTQQDEQYLQISTNHKCTLLFCRYWLSLSSCVCPNIRGTCENERCLNFRTHITKNKKLSNWNCRFTHDFRYHLLSSYYYSPVQTDIYFVLWDELNTVLIYIKSWASLASLILKKSEHQLASKT